MSRDALIVGINSYQYLNSLKAPASDAEAIAQMLEQNGDFSKVQRLPEAIQEAGDKKPVVSTTGSVSKKDLEDALKNLFWPGSAQGAETAIFYFSGHGIPDSEGFHKGYLAVSDTNPAQPDTGISLQWLQWLLSQSSVKQQIIWLDCCHSGGLLVNVGAANPGNSESRDRCFIASSRNFENSWEDLNSPYSVLTKALLEGLDPTRLPGRWIDTAAIVDYVNQALKGELQIPVCTLFGEAINLTRSWQVSESEPDDKKSSTICPYKGLEFFDCNEEDPKYFFGRERLISKLLDHVRTSNFLALVGASGNGKSSVLRAGLLHQIKLGRRISGSEQWRIRITRPDDKPMQGLAKAFIDEGLSDLERGEALVRASNLLKEGVSGLQSLVQASTAPRVILVIDQFEEVFTRCENIKEREEFFECLITTLSDAGNKLCLIIAMRADFLGKCLEQKYSGLGQKIQQQMISVFPLERDELRDAICKPAQQVDLEIDPQLVTEILNDIAGAPGSLPLLQYTLKELWHQRQGNRLVLKTYQDLGGINGTLDKRATEIYNSFNTQEQQTVQYIFLQLTQLGEGAEDTRRRVFQADLIAEPLHPAQRVAKVIEHLSSSENRLLVTSEVVSKGNESKRMAIVDVAHEALIRHWKLLRQWLEQNQDLLRKQRKIEASATHWQEQGELSRDLLIGFPLTEAIQFKKQYSATFPLPDFAGIFIKRSRRKRWLNRIIISSWLIIPGLLLTGVVEYNLREDKVREDFAQLNKQGTPEQTQAVIALVEGCAAHTQREWLPKYLAERLFGNCRLLKAAKLQKANLSYANLSYANLSYADLSYADLSYANLSYADLSMTNLKNANLFGADLSNAYLKNANLSYVDLSMTNLKNANLSYADLSMTNLKNAHFINANLSAANLSYANISYADLMNAHLSAANLSNANLSNAYLSNAYLFNADLSNANLINANLINADLMNANLSNANLNNAVLNNAVLNSSILLGTDFRDAKNLTVEQFTGENQPFLCNIALPTYLKNEAGIPLIDPNRDCDNMQLLQILTERDPSMDLSIEEARKIVDEVRSKKWD